MSVAKRHHTVPQFYLRHFADQEQITTVRLPGELRFTQSVRRAASQTNFYAVDGHEDGPDAFEKVLSAIEGQASNVFASILSGAWPLPSELRMTLAGFIALQAVRGPDQRRNMEHVAAQVARLEIGYGGREGVKGWVKRARGVSITDEQADVVWSQATQPDGPPIRMAPIAHIQQMVKTADELLPYIAGRPWSLVRFDKRSLITCDTPVGLVPHPENEPWEGVGFMTAWGITFPLTRKLGILMSDPMVFAGKVPVETVHAGRMDYTQVGTTALEKFFNGNTIANAGEWLYHHPCDERFVPATLPEPNPVTLRMAGGPDEFSGDPLFSSRNED